MPNKRAYVETIDESWRQWDPDLAASALAPGFTLDDPA